MDKHPGIAQSAVILGGGRAVQRLESWKGIKVYAAAGDKDFGLSGTQAFAKSLGQMESKPELEVFKSTEHLGIVQVAWDKIFNWLGSPSDFSRSESVSCSRTIAFFTLQAFQQSGWGECR